MHILVINCGSSSIKADVIDTFTQNSVIKLDAERLPATPAIQLNDTKLNYAGELSMDAILSFCLTAIKNKLEDKTIAGIGHRVVHGGDKYNQPVLIDDKVEAAIQELCALAPLHNPSNLLGIQKAKAIFTDIPNVAVFDTAFHQTLPKRAAQYAIDKTTADKYGIKRYGFHGTSHKYVCEKAAAFFKAGHQSS